MTVAALFTSAAPARIERLAHAGVLALAMTILLAPAAGWSWLAALAGLLLAAWPLALAERALAIRAGGRPLIAGMQHLTREADAPRFWRVIAWSSLAASLAALVLMALVAGVLLAQSVQTLAGGPMQQWPGSSLWPVLTVAALLFGSLRASWRVHVLFWLLPALALLLALGWQIRQQAIGTVLTDLPLASVLPAGAGLLFGALVLGGGMGALWMQAPAVTAGAAAGADGARAKLPALLLTTLVVALLLAGLQLGQAGQLATLLAGFAAVLALTVLVQPLLAQARALQLPPLLAPWLVLVPAVLLAETVTFFIGRDALPQLVTGLAVWLLVNLLLMSLFAGWVMKISHVRKALQLPSEGVYNLWRVGVRLLAPITLLLAIWQLLAAA